MKGLINIKNNNNKCFLWCHPERITKADENMVNDLDYEGIEFSASKKLFARLKRKTIFALIYFVMRVFWFILFISLIKNLKIVWIYC